MADKEKSANKGDGRDVDRKECGLSKELADFVCDRALRGNQPFIANGGMKQRLEQLQEKGLAERSAYKDDRRAPDYNEMWNYTNYGNWHLTGKGETLAWDIVDGRKREALKQMSADDMAAVRSMLLIGANVDFHAGLFHYREIGRMAQVHRKTDMVAKLGTELKDLQRRVEESLPEEKRLTWGGTAGYAMVKRLQESGVLYNDLTHDGLITSEFGLTLLGRSLAVDILEPSDLDKRQRAVLDFMDIRARRDRSKDLKLKFGDMEMHFSGLQLQVSNAFDIEFGEARVAIKVLDRLGLIEIKEDSNAGVQEADLTVAGLMLGDRIAADDAAEWLKNIRK